ncbi:MAG TPA: ABC transporter permease [Candidatus Acidoferrales bacterium]|nr:ABC transporter permease [Candidatus Acidoferrales bacterium]
MKPVIQLFKNSYRVFLNDRVAVLLTFIVPLVLMFIFGSIFNGGGEGPQGIPIAVLSQSNSDVVNRIISTLDTMKAFRVVDSVKNNQGKLIPFDTTSIKEYVKNGKATAGILFPADAYTDTSSALQLKFYYDPKNDMEMQTVEGLLQEAVFSHFPSIIAQSGFRQARKFLGTDSGQAFNKKIASVVGKYFKIDTGIFLHPDRWIAARSDSDTSKTNSNFMNNIVRIDKEQVVGEKLKNQWATRTIGGWALTFLLFALTASSSSLFDERKSGLMLRILTSPVSRVHILWSKYLFNMSLAIVQLLLMFVVGWLMFQVDIFSNFLNLMLIIISASTACTAFGMLLAAVSKTRQQANGLGTLLILTMSAIGGAWFPTFLMPSGIQFISKLTFVYWAMDGFLEVLWRGVGTVDILPHIGILLGIGAVVNAASVWQFKRGDIFS